MFIQVFASGTNVQRLAKSASKVDGVLYTAYSELEASEEKIIKRKFYSANLVQLKDVVEAMDETVQPSWTKIWGKPNANRAFISTMFNAFVGNESLIPSLNLDQITSDTISTFMVLTSANKNEMSQAAKIIEKSVEGFNVVILNGDHTTNKEAETETKKAINIAKAEGKRGIIILANQMGSRSYSISEIQATIMAYDRGSVDATQQKVSRSLTPGKTFEGDKKEFGHIIDLSFDPNRSENIERLLIDEIVQVQKSKDIDFPAATSFVLNSIDLSKVNEYGYVEEVTEADMFDIVGDNENLLRIADVTVDVDAIIDSGLLDALSTIVVTQSKKSKKLIAGQDVINKVKSIDIDRADPKKKDPAVKKIEDIINNAVKTLNNSATSVFFMADGGETYRECVSKCPSDEFEEIFGVVPAVAISLLDSDVLNEPLLDVIVQNSKQAASIW